VRLFPARFQGVFQPPRVRDNPSSFVVLQAIDQDRYITRAPFFAGFLIPKTSIRTFWWCATDLNPAESRAPITNGMVRRFASQMLQHLRSVKVGLTPLHSTYCSAIGSCTWFCSCSWERISIPPSVSGMASGRLAGRGGVFLVCLWCSCPDNQFWLPNSPGFRLFGSLVIPSWQSGLGDPAAGLRGTSWLSTPARFLAPSRSGDGGSGMSHSPLGALSAGRK
jgi:hypothetical protein